MKTLERILRYLKKEYKSATVTSAGDQIIMVLPLASHDSGWVMTAEELEWTFDSDEDIKKFDISMVVGMGKDIPDYIAILPEFYKTFG